MALFSRFRRNKTDQTGMPAEVRDYYKAEGRERSGLAWLLALGTLLLTVLIVLGLFMGGRWAFRKLKNSDDKPTQVAVQQDEAREDSQAASGSNDNDAPTTQPAPASPSTGTGSNQPSSPTGGTSTPPASSPTARNLANTGPGDTAAVFVAVSMLAYLAHRKFLAN